MKHGIALKEITILLVTLASIILFFAQGCSSGHGGGVAVTPESARLGFFVDSPVDGLQFKTLSWSGITGLSLDRGYFYWEQRTYLPDITGLPGAQGTFLYQDGEQITFSIGDVILGRVKAKGIITPLDLGGANKKTSNPKVINISRLLLSLDDDRDPSNGITISESVLKALTGIKVDLSDTTLDNSAGIQEMFKRLNGLGIYPEEVTHLVSAEEAQIHLENIINQIAAEEEIIAEEAKDLPLIASIGSPSGNVIMLQGQSLSLQGTVLGGRTPYTYSWNFDGEQPFSNVKDPGARVFGKLGSYTLHFMVEDGADVKREDSRFITVLGKETQEGPFLPDSVPAVQINYPPDKATFKAGDTVYFQALLYNGDVPLYYNWTLGAVPGNSFVQGSEEVDLISPRTYIITQGITLTSPGTYTISISVKDTKKQKLLPDAGVFGVTITVE
jgi:hypothetical protein